MADYFPVLSRAVAGLPTNDADSRRAVYDRARAAVIRQLRGLDPPLSEEDIERERRQLEDAIRRIETEQAPTPSKAPAPPAPPTQRPAPAEPRTPPATRAPGPRTSEAELAEQPASRERTAEPRPAPAAGPRRGPETRADGRPIIRAAGAPGGQSPTRRSGPLVALGALALIAVGVAAFAARDQIAGLFGGEAPSTETASNETRPDETATPAERPEEPGKTADRVPGAEPSAPPPEQPAEPPAGETEVARAPETPPPGAQPQPPAAEQPPQQPTPAPSAPGPLVAQRAILYEEGSDQQSGEQIEGAVVWRTESVSVGQGQPLETALRGDIDIPGRNLKATVTIRRNVDATLPASHTIEVQFKLPENFPNAGVANVPGILMKTDEATRGAPVSGLSVRVTSGFFLIGLSNIENERAANEQLLRERSWIDVPILYDNGRRAVLTLEKGTPGAQAFNDAFAAWQAAAAQR